MKLRLLIATLVTAFLCGQGQEAMGGRHSVHPRGQSAITSNFIIANGDVAGLKAAIIAANGNAQDDTIELAAGGTYVLSLRDNGLNGLPVIGADGGHSLTIHGNGATIQLATSGPRQSLRFFYIGSGGNLTLTDLTLANGNPGAFHGGAIYNDATTGNATLTVIGCTFTNNSGDYGGAIFNDGSGAPNTATLTVTNSTFSGNFTSQYGGAIWNESGSIVMIVSNCTFSLNTAVNDAGAIQFDGSAGTANGSITNCTFTQNSAGRSGGAISVDGEGGFDSLGNMTSGSAALAIVNCTFDHNSASSGGGLAMDGSNANGPTGNATVKVDSCTFNRNSGSGLYLSQTGAGTTVLHLGNTLLQTGGAGANLAVNNQSGGTATITSHGYNLADDAPPALTAAGDQINTNALLDPAGLKDNGGLTQTIALQSGSPALDQGNSKTISANSVDQRGEPRPFDDPNVPNAIGGDGSDIGAYEADVRTISSNISGVDFQIRFTTILGHTYEVQSRTSLSSGNWTTVNNTIPSPPISGTGGIVQVTIPNALMFSSAFYRLHQLP